MSKRLMLLLEFIKEADPEMHFQEYGEDEIVIFIYPFWIEDFAKIFEGLCDEGFEFTLRADYFTFILNDFIKDYCEIEIEDFIKLAKQ